MTMPETASDTAPVRLPSEPPVPRGRILITDVHVLDVRAGVLGPRASVLVEGRRIVAVTTDRIDGRDAVVVDGGGRTLMPGLVDCHVHIDSAIMGPVQTMARTTSVAVAYRELEAMLRRGFTTARDAGGADAGYKAALDRGLVTGPRYFVACDLLTQTGGHGDHRSGFDLCGDSTGDGKVIADGVDEVRKQVRENVRRGADHIKLMVSGGISSPTDRLDGMQYSDDEIAVAVAEADRGGIYVAAHAYSDDAVHRAARLGIRTVEHGSLITDRAAKAMAEAGTILVPTLSPYHWVKEAGDELGLPAEHVRRGREVHDASLEAVALAERYGVTLASGSDLFRVPKGHQAYELVLRAQVQERAEVLRSATLGGAEVVGLAGQVGEVAPGFLADLLVVDGDPLTDLGVLQDEGAHLAAIVRDGEVVHCRLPCSGTAA